MGLKQILIAKAFIELFRCGLKHKFPEQVGQQIESNWNKWMGERKSEKLQAKFESFLDDFTKRLIVELRKDRV